MAISAVADLPLHWIVAQHAWFATLAAVWDVVAVEVGECSSADLAVVDDAVTVAVGLPFDKEG
jgi:hypothetical protein